MNVRMGAVILGAAFVCTTVLAEEKKALEKIGGAFNVKAITGENKGKTLCYV